METLLLLWYKFVCYKVKVPSNNGTQEQNKKLCVVVFSIK